jgi:hypothetical protein
VVGVEKKERKSEWQRDREKGKRKTKKELVRKREEGYRRE